MLDFEESWSKDPPPQDEPEKKKKEKKSSDDLLAIVEALNTAYNGADQRPDRIQ